MKKARKPRHRILLVDDHPMTRMGLKMLIACEPDLGVCGEAESAAAGLDACIRLSPSLVLSDVSLPGRSGFELVQDLAARCPGTPVLIVSMHPEAAYARRAIEIGARGYVMKSEDGASLLSAIRTVLSGRIHVSESVAGRLLEFIGPRKNGHHTGVEALTPREFEVFKLLGEGLPTRLVAKRLNMSPKTVDTHCSRIKEKMDAPTMPALVASAAQWLALQNVAPAGT